MSNFENAYKSLIRDVLVTGEITDTRNAVTQSVFGRTLVIDTLLTDRFPLITGRKMYLKGIAGEFATFLQGPESVSDFTDNGCNYWNKWSDDDGNLKLDYGNAWTDWDGINQIEEVLYKLKTHPKDRRMIITGWNPSNLVSLSLPCCHMLYQFHVTTQGQLNMLWYQRSADLMVGVPSDIVLAAIFLKTMANEAGLMSGTITMVFGDTHIYEDHKDAAVQYLERTIYEPPSYDLTAGIRTFKPDDLSISNYVHGSPIKFTLHG